MTGDADRFALWILHDQAAQQREREPEVQLELFVASKIRAAEKAADTKKAA